MDSAPCWASLEFPKMAWKERLTVVIRRPEGLICDPPPRWENDKVSDGHSRAERLGSQHCENGWILRTHKKRVNSCKGGNTHCHSYMTVFSSDSLISNQATQGKWNDLGLSKCSSHSVDFPLLLCLQQNELIAVTRILNYIFTMLSPVKWIWKPASQPQAGWSQLACAAQNSWPKGVLTVMWKWTFKLYRVDANVGRSLKALVCCFLTFVAQVENTQI